MSDVTRRVLTEEERARIQAARNEGGLCGRCGRTLAPGEPVWIERLVVQGRHGDRDVVWWVVVGGECAAPDAGAREPGVCVACRRPVFGDAPTSRRRLVVCSTRCRRAYDAVQFKERHRT